MSTDLPILARPASETAWEAREAVGREMLYGAFVFVKIWIKGGGARRYPSLPLAHSYITRLNTPDSG